MEYAKNLFKTICRLNVFWWKCYTPSFISRYFCTHKKFSELRNYDSSVLHVIARLQVQPFSKFLLLLLLHHKNFLLVDLSTALNADALSGLLNNPEALEQLQSHLPAVDSNTQEALRSTLQSPQFQQVREWLWSGYPRYHLFWWFP